MTWRDEGWFAQPSWSTAHRLRPDVMPPKTLCGRSKRRGWVAPWAGLPQCIQCLRRRKHPFAEDIPTNVTFTRVVDVIYRPNVLRRPIIDVPLPAVG